MMKRKITVLLLVAICVAIAATGTLAYFNQEDTAHNVITTGGVDIEVQEWADEAMTEPFADQTGVMPGTSVTKIALVKNTGSAAAWLRVKLDVAVQGADKESLSTEPIVLDIGENWKLQDGYYYYQKPLAPGELSDPIFTTVTFKPEMGNEYQRATATVDLSAQAVQTANNGDNVMDAKGWPESAEPTPTMDP